VTLKSISLLELLSYFCCLYNEYAFVAYSHSYQVLRQNLDRTFKNVKIVSNRMVFNDDGQLVSFKGIIFGWCFIIHLSAFINSHLWFFLWKTEISLRKYQAFDLCHAIINYSLFTFHNTGKLIHVLNKNEHALDMAAPLHDRLGVDIGEEDEENVNMKERRNVLLMGDHLGDLRMSDGLDYETRISIGFL